MDDFLFHRHLIIVCVGLQLIAMACDAFDPYSRAAGNKIRKRILPRMTLSLVILREASFLEETTERIR